MNRHLKVVTIILGGVYMPFAMYIGYCFGAGRILAGSIAMGFYIILSITDGYIFWKLLGGLNDKRRK